MLERFYSRRRFNVHPSFLPQLRGPAPIQHAIAQQLNTSGVSVVGIQPLKEGIDTGDIWEQKAVVS
jgi:methionyl-tRNA formyltransferase